MIIFDTAGTTSSTATRWCHSIGPELNSSWGRTISLRSELFDPKKYFKYLLIKNIRHNYGSPYPVPRSWRDERYPSWWEFVQYLLHTSPNR